MKETPDTWIRVSRAAEMLGVSEDTVRRMVATDRLEATDDPAALTGTGRGRGRPPALLVSLRSVQEARARQYLASAVRESSFSSDLLERVPELEAEVARLRADVANLREVALRSLERDEHLERAERARLEAERARIDADAERLAADRARRAQLAVYLVPDFVDD